MHTNSKLNQCTWALCKPVFKLSYTVTTIDWIIKYILLWYHSKVRCLFGNPENAETQSKDPVGYESEVCFLGLVLLLNTDMTLSTNYPNIKTSLGSLHWKLLQWMVDSLLFYNLWFHFYREQWWNKSFHVILYRMKWNEKGMIYKDFLDLSKSVHRQATR